MAQEFPIGINLGLDHLTSAYMIGTGEVVTVAKIETSQAWKDFFLDTQSQTRSKCYGGIYQFEGVWRYHPVHPSLNARCDGTKTWSKSRYQRLYTAIEVYPSVKDVMQVGSYMDYIRRVYGLNTPEGLGYAPGADLDDYQKDFLEVSIMHVTDYADIRERVFRIDDYGGSENVASAEAITDLKARFSKLLDDQIKDNSYINTSPEDFCFIIFSGGASPSEFQKIHQAVIEVVPDFSDRFLDSIDPSWVTAVGAARRAKEYFFNPPDIHKHINYQIVEDGSVPEAYFHKPSDKGFEHLDL